MNQSVGLVVIIPLLLRGVVISAINTNINGLRCCGRGKKDKRATLPTDTSACKLNVLLCCFSSGIWVCSRARSFKTQVKTRGFKMVNYQFAHVFRPSMYLSIIIPDRSAVGQVLDSHTHSLNMQINAAPKLLQEEGAYYTNLNCIHLQLE